MAETPVKSESFVMVIDRDTYRIMNGMMNVITDRYGAEFVEKLCKRDLGEKYLSFLKEFSDKAHAAGMCEDPNCEDKKKI